MTSIEFEKIIEVGLKELGLEWPYDDTLYEFNINRQIQDPITHKGRSIKSTLEYFKFLNDNVFPIVDDLESKAKIEYWHILNHKALDIRLSISSDLQMKEVMGDARAEIALNILSFLISLSYATIIKTRCPWCSAPCDGARNRKKKDIH